MILGLEQNPNWVCALTPFRCPAQLPSPIRVVFLPTGKDVHRMTKETNYTADVDIIYIYKIATVVCVFLKKQGDRWTVTTLK